MAFILSIKELIEYMNEEYDTCYGKQYGKAVTIVLKTIFEKKTKLKYSDVFDLDFSNPRNRTFAGATLGGIWYFCHDYYIPELNFLIVREFNPRYKGADLLPGEGPMNFYESIFGTLKHYDLWCNNKIQECLLYMQDSLLVLKD